MKTAIAAAIMIILMAFFTPAAIVKMLDKQTAPSNVLDIAAFYERTKASVVSIKSEAGIGTGFAVRNPDNSIAIATAYHVIEGLPADTRDITIVTDDGKVLMARVADADKNNDLAILKTEHSLNVPPLQIGNSSLLRVGELVIVIGNPLGHERSITTGIISGIRKEYVGELQFDALVEDGNSGSPVFNKNGEVVGIAESKDGGFGFAVPSESLRQLIQKQNPGQ